ncbi:MAG TPA: HAD-IIIA family hydrolase [Candidatus Omnitrophota bacterium]|nr:HAD-IIIA family hydrolase [Candidatus Omnitrophota bacterium]HPS19846.1 HAD-IIIA family hydrolase [Candidatus Omnitrophota bacterium]
MKDPLKKYTKEIVRKAAAIKLLLLDVDGVLTDGRLIYGNSGEEMKNFDVNDGLGIFMLKKAGIKRALLTAKATKAVKIRAKELQIEKVYGGFHYKLEVFEKVQKDFKVKPSEICFVGDDLIDVPVLKRCGLAVCPPNAAREVKEYADLITDKKGGRGAVRELCDLILRATGKWEEATERYFE